MKEFTDEQKKERERFLRNAAQRNQREEYKLAKLEIEELKKQLQEKEEADVFLLPAWKQNFLDAGRQDLLDLTANIDCSRATPIPPSASITLKLTLSQLREEMMKKDPELLRFLWGNGDNVFTTDVPNQWAIQPVENQKILMTVGRHGEMAERPTLRPTKFTVLR